MDVAAPCDRRVALPLVLGRGGTAHGVLARGPHGDLELHLERLGWWSRARVARELRSAGAAMAAGGVRMQVLVDGRPLLVLGEPSVPWWQRTTVRSRGVRYVG